MAVVKAALIAAGRGERLRHGGISTPKPLVPIAGIPLIERVIAAATEVGVTRVAAILNANSDADAVEAHCRRTFVHLDLQIMRRTTPSSMESLFALAPLLGEPFLLLTVDAIFGPTVLPSLLEAWRIRSNLDGVLAVHNYIDDEKPLRVRIDESSRIRAFGADAGDSPLITAGLYMLTPRIFSEIPAARAARYTALREFLAHLCAHDYSLLAVPVAKTIDVDRPEDIAIAEQFVRADFAE